MKANPNYTFLQNKVPNQRVTLLQGGTRSGKTYSALYYILDLCRKYDGMEIDITRNTLVDLKATAWKDFYDILVACNVYRRENHNKTDRIYSLFGNLVYYYGADNPGPAHGRSRDLLYINEAQLFPEESIEQLFPRTRHKIIADYNPAIGLDHWLDPYIEKYPPLITTYKDNPYLTASQVEEIEFRMSRSKYYRKVYGDGERAPREGVIFEGWIEGSFDAVVPYCYGLDYGFNPDPCGMLKVGIDRKRKRIYLKEEIYSTDLSIDDLEAAIKSSLDRPKDLIVCDTNENRTTYELQKRKINITRTKKNEIIDDIREIEAWQLVVCGDSPNLKKELNNYIWNDKKSSTPIDAFNHLLDPMRYAFNRLKTPSATMPSIAKFKRR